MTESEDSWGWFLQQQEGEGGITMPQNSIEERLFNLEKQSVERLALLEQEVQDLKQELARWPTLEGLRTDVQELRARYQAHEEDVTERLNDFEGHVTTRMDVLEGGLTAKIQDLQTGQMELRGSVQDLRAGQQELHSGQEALQAGQDQILAILTGKACTND
jgi:chromosome segregation ATPase